MPLAFAEKGLNFALTLDEAAISPKLWQEVDVQRLAAAITVGQGTSRDPARPRTTWMPAGLIGPDLGSERVDSAARLTSVPLDAFVVVGRTARVSGARFGRRTVKPRSLTPTPPLSPVPASTANDNRELRKATQATRSRRSMVRDLFFFGVLLAAIFGAYQSGRLRGYSRVIVVPGPSLPSSVVT